MELTKINKNQIHCRLTSSEYYKYWDEVVKIHVAGDIWQSWYVDLGSDENCRCTAPITYKLMQTMQLNIDDLRNIAITNDHGKCTINTMTSVLFGLTGMDMDDCSLPIHVISNKSAYCGAAAILDQTIRQRIRDLHPNGCYVIPSSVHEMLIVGQDVDPDTVVAMIKDINNTMVDECDRLSDHLFRFDGYTLSVAR